MASTEERRRQPHACVRRRAFLMREPVNVCTNVWPGGKLPPKRPATSSTTVCVMEPVFAQHTDCPSITVTEDGVNAYSVTSTVMAAPLLAHRLVDEELVELLQATAVRAKKASSTRLIRMHKDLRQEEGAPPNGSRLSCGRNAHRRKAVERQIERMAGEATQVFPTWERPAASSAC